MVWKVTYCEYIEKRRQVFYIIGIVGSMTNHMGYVKHRICMKSIILKVNIKMNMTLSQMMFGKTPRCLSWHFSKHLDVLVDVA